MLCGKLLSSKAEQWKWEIVLQCFTEGCAMKSQLSAAALVLVVTLTSLAQSSAHDLKAELESKHNQWFAAFDKGDGATMDGMEVPNLVIILGNGTIWQKPGPRAGKQKPTGASHTLTDASVRQFGNTAVLTGIVTTKVAGSPDRRESTTVVWVHQSGKWMVASAQWSQVTSPSS